MINNMGVLDRIIRVIIAIVIVVLYYYGQMTGLAAIILGLIAVLFFMTSCIGYCPVYHLLGISTKKK
jgi:Na+(H+)/acetate symporter ActP